MTAGAVLSADCRPAALTAAVRIDVCISIYVYRSDITDIYWIMIENNYKLYNIIINLTELAPCSTFFTRNALYV